MRAKFTQLFALIAMLAPLLGVANLALAGQTPPGATRRSPTFTVRVVSAFAWSAPNLCTAGDQRVFAGQTFRLRARTADSRWLELDSAGSKTGVWVPAAWGTVSGNLEQVPVIAAPACSPPLEREACGGNLRRV